MKFKKISKKSFFKVNVKECTEFKYLLSIPLPGLKDVRILKFLFFSLIWINDN